MFPEEIRRARESPGFSQQAFAEYLGVGEASIKRWELGSLQDKSSDDLIRLKTDPDYARRSLDQLCRRLSRSPLAVNPAQSSRPARATTARRSSSKPESSSAASTITHRSPKSKSRSPSERVIR